MFCVYTFSVRDTSVFWFVLEEKGRKSCFSRVSSLHVLCVYTQCKRDVSFSFVLNEKGRKSRFARVSSLHLLCHSVYTKDEGS